MDSANWTTRLRLLALLWMSLWLVVVAPGHTRGIVRMFTPEQADGCCGGSSDRQIIQSNQALKLPSCCLPQTSSALTTSKSVVSKSKGESDNGCGLTDACDSSHQGQPEPYRDPAKDCMLCYLRSTLDVAVQWELTTPPFFFAFEHPRFIVEVICFSLDTPRDIIARGPPTYL